MKYKVTNKFDDVRKFRDGNIGRDVFVEPHKSVLTERPPKENEVWRVEPFEKKEEKKKPLEKEVPKKSFIKKEKVLIKDKKMEEIKNDGSSNR